MKREIVGKCLEYYRLKNGIAFQSFLWNQKHEVCSTTTYKKVIAGECRTDEVYCELVHYHGVKLDKTLSNVNADLLSIINCLFSQSYEEAKLWMEKIINDRKEESYPSTCYYDFIVCFYEFLFFEKVYKRNELNGFKMMMDVLSKEFQMGFYFLCYRNMNRRSADTQSLLDFVANMQVNMPEGIMKQLMLMDYYRFRDEYAKSNELAHEIVDALKDTQSYFQYEVYQALHGNYMAMGKPEQANEYLTLLLAKLDTCSVGSYAYLSISFYLSMNYFFMYELDDAYRIMKPLLEKDAERNLNLIHPYLHILSRKGLASEMNDYPSLIEPLNPSKKLFSQYYKMKQNNALKARLVKFIQSKLIPSIREGNIFNYHILLDELLVLGCDELFFETYTKLKCANYVIMKDWDKVFHKNCKLL